MERNVMAPDGKSFTLDGDSEFTVQNPNPATLEYTFRMAKGSFIRFTLPAGGSFTIKNCGDVVAGDMTVLSVSPYGPRPVDMDGKPTG